jgi:hypothetical protein
MYVSSLDELLEFFPNLMNNSSTLGSSSSAHCTSGTASRRYQRAKETFHFDIINVVTQSVHNEQMTTGAGDALVAAVAQYHPACDPQLDTGSFRRALHAMALPSALEVALSLAATVRRRGAWA